MSLKTCKACNKEIGNKVKKCVHCGTDQRSWFGRHKVLSFIGAIIILGIIGSAMGGGNNGTNTASSNNSASSTATEGKPQVEKTFTLNQPVQDNDAQVTVTNVETKTKVGNEYVNKKVSEGGVFVAVQYKIKNTSSKPIGAISLPTVKLMDEAGNSYDADIDASSNYSVEKNIDNSKVMSDLNPGITVKDSKVFEISKDSYSKGKWFIVVGDNKISVK